MAEALGVLAAAEAEGTRRNYATDWRSFVAWCAGHGLERILAKLGVQDQREAIVAAHEAGWPGNQVI